MSSKKLKKTAAVDDAALNLIIIILIACIVIIAVTTAYFIVTKTAGTGTSPNETDTNDTPAGVVEDYPFRPNISTPSFVDDNCPMISEDAINSDYAIIVDVTTGKFVASRKGSQVIYPASMTKIMTLIVAYENIKDLDSTTYTFDAAIENAGGIDLQVLGIGVNGHIGFNEPASELPANTNKVTLTESTIEANSRFFESKDMVPKAALTLGIGGIMKAKRIVVLASGKSKAPIIKELFEGNVTTNVPVSLMQLHPDVTIVMDEEAASLL